MKKSIYYFLISFISLILLFTISGCDKKKSELSINESSSSSAEVNINETSETSNTSAPNDISIVSGTWDSYGEGWSKVVFTVKNNRSESINTLLIYVAVTNNKNQIVRVEPGSAGVRIKPGQYINIPVYFKNEQNVCSAYIDSYICDVNGKNEEKFVDNSPIVTW